MCVIAISKKGIRQPSVSELRSMWKANPHGGGYMSIRNGKVEIHKGFLFWEDFIRSVRSESFSENDPVVYHFRIATQGGINEDMTHPFPITSNLEFTRKLDVICNIGVAHNGIIPLTTSATEKEYSDTALFITKYLSVLLRSAEDIHNKHILKMIDELGKSKFAFLNSNGDIETVGKFFDDNGIIVSNLNHKYDWTKYYQRREQWNYVSSF